MIGWGAVYGAGFGLLLLLTRPLLPGLFAVTPQVRGLLLAVLVVAALQQPVAGVVFVLDGVLIGAGDQNYLALAGVVTLAVYLPVVLLVPALHGGLVALWLAYSLWLLARFVTLVLRARGDALAGDRRRPPLTAAAQAGRSRETQERRGEGGDGHAGTEPGRGRGLGRPLGRAAAAIHARPGGAFHRADRRGRRGDGPGRTRWCSTSAAGPARSACGCWTGSPGPR